VRIALVCPYAWDDAGGVQVHVRELGERLRERSHHVVGLAPVRRAAAESWIRGVGRPVDLTYNASSAPIDPRPWSAAQVRAELRGFRPDVVHVHEPFAPSTTLWAVLTSPAPVVATFHSGATRSRLFDLAAPVLRVLARRLAVRVAVSRAAAQFAGSRLGGPFEMVPNGLDVGRFADATPGPDLAGLEGVKLLFCGRLDERKGFPVAVEAFELLLQSRPSLRLVVAGDGPDRAAADLLPADARKRVTMLGAVPHDDLPPVHTACDLFLGTAVGGESFGYVLAEAMAAGLPVVASDIPGYDEVITNEVDGLLVPPRDPAAVAAAAARVLDDPALAARLSGGGRDRVRSFDWSTVVTRLEELYERAARLR
jgi:phosphatidylinositol alpha-mannosyltransferase